MRIHHCVRLLLFVTLFDVPGTPAALAATPLATKDLSANELVEAALKAELAGDATERKALLDRALVVDPDHSPARWQSGFVRIDNQWTKIDEVPKQVLLNADLEAYRKRRDALIDTADNHRALAQWCQANRLPTEARLHWAKVLQYDLQDVEAQRGLGLKWYDGRLMSRQQIVEEQARAAERAEVLKKWQPEFHKWRLAMLRGNVKDRDEAVAKFQALDDPAVIPALEAVLSLVGTSKASNDANLQLITTVGRWPTPEATAVLLRRAVLADSPIVRNAACDELKKRPMHAYVPQLIAAIPGKIKTQFNIFLLPNGMVYHEHEILLEGRTANLSMTFDSSMFSADGPNSIAAQRAVSREARQSANIERTARANKERLDWLRGRIEAALARTTGFNRVEEPELWEKQYNDQFGWQTPSPEKPTIVQNVSRAEASAAVPVNETRSTQLTNPAPPVPWPTSSSHMSCFAAGTNVCTLTGPRPIETVKIGDRVLSQDIATGELGYQSVQATTIRTCSELLKIEIEGESIVTTAGHPFWVLGRGWVVAKNLEAGHLLHGLNGAQRIQKVEPHRSLEVYNLVVSETHNYCVGARNLLVHDNGPLVEHAEQVPGLAYKGQ